MARYRYAAPAQDRRPEQRGTYVNRDGIISHGLRAAGDVPATADIKHLEPCDRFAAALAAQNAVVLTPEEDEFLEFEVREIMDLAS